jgi:hypothetical protein
MFPRSILWRGGCQTNRSADGGSAEFIVAPSRFFGGNSRCGAITRGLDPVKSPALGSNGGLWRLSLMRGRIQPKVVQ